MRQFVSQVVVGPIILMILWFSRVPIQSFVAVPLLRKSGTRRLFLDTLGYVPTGYETSCVPNCCGSHYFDQSYVKWVGTTAQLFAKFTQLISNLTLLYSMLLIKIQKIFLDWLCYISSKETTFPSRIFDEFEAFWYFLAIFQFWPYSKRSPKVKFEDVKKQRVVVSTIWFFRLRFFKYSLVVIENLPTKSPGFLSDRAWSNIGQDTVAWGCIGILVHFANPSKKRSYDKKKWFL